MVVLLNNKPATEQGQKQLHRLTERVFYKSIELLGGLRNLAEYRTLTWLPSLARACYVVVLHDEYLYSIEKIAEYLGISTATVRNIISADKEAALHRVKSMDQWTDEERQELKVHIAGGVAEEAYERVKRGEEAQTIITYAHSVAEQTMQECDRPWAYAVLKATRGVDYPITSAETLMDLLEKASLKDFDVKSVAAAIDYPVNNPAELLKKIKKVLAE